MGEVPALVRDSAIIGGPRLGEPRLGGASVGGACVGGACLGPPAGPCTADPAVSILRNR
jgi:hypothetical protein